MASLSAPRLAGTCGRCRGGRRRSCRAAAACVRSAPCRGRRSGCGRRRAAVRRRRRPRSPACRASGGPLPAGRGRQRRGRGRPRACAGVAADLCFGVDAAHRQARQRRGPDDRGGVAGGVGGGQMDGVAEAGERERDVDCDRRLADAALPITSTAPWPVAARSLTSVSSGSRSRGRSLLCWWRRPPRPAGSARVARPGR